MAVETHVLKTAYEPGGRVTGREWDLQGRIAGRLDGWPYDAAGRLASIPGRIASIGYDGARPSNLRQRGSATAGSL